MLEERDVGRRGYSLAGRRLCSKEQAFKTL